MPQHSVQPGPHLLSAHSRSGQTSEFFATSQGYYDDEGDSEMSGAHVDEEVAVTKRGRAVKLPAKYKAEVSISCSTILEPCISAAKNTAPILSHASNIAIGSVT